MKKNRKHGALLRLLWRQGRITDDGTARYIVLGVAGVVVLTALAAGGAYSYVKLHKQWMEQCVVTDLPRQVSVKTGANVTQGTLLEAFGIRKGTNLATIDYAECRKRALANFPNLRSLTVERRMPDRVLITAEDRLPVARLDVIDAKRPSGRVVDTEGVVFKRIPGTDNLPCIRERRNETTEKGARLTGRTLAALKLVEMCAERDFAELRLSEVSLKHKDSLLATLGNASRVKIAWEGMDDTTPESQATLRKTLGNLRDVVRTRLGEGAVTWNATMPNRIFADTKEPIQ